MMQPPHLPRPSPSADVLPGRWVELQRLNVQRHASGLWRAIGSHPDLWVGVPPGPFEDEADFTDWLDARADRLDQVLYTVIDLTDPQKPPVGLYLLINLAPAMGTAEIGLVYGPALARRTGGTEAFLLLAEHVLGALGYRRLEWRCKTTNAASRRAAERLGFTPEGVLRQTLWLKGDNWDTAVYAILDSEWPPRAARLHAWLAPENFDEQGRRRTPLTAI